MFFLVLFIVVLLAIAAFAALPALRPAKAPGGTVSGDAPKGGVTPQPTTLEGALARQLMHGEVNRSQYRNALERLAARDDKEHPMSVPDRGDFSAGA
ncbi:hypothetical protein [Actinoplanes sp. L3-i22]|uniref:hypothetical protein n=1 Tax=Actinoplanes sp. L3-i22 TaxID=2836373 RepID=UPI001C76F102|nr:hypothetical protein [Actinoplanes sp. L3-i22]BCY09440.1 hypothetical protein L3i22_045280 [Actinoplanes sp. L3-i22]